jgi:hypothetical protein
MDVSQLALDWPTLLAGITPLLAILAGAGAKWALPRIPKILIPLVAAALGGILGELNPTSTLLSGAESGLVGVGLHGILRRIIKDFHAGTLSKNGDPTP